MQNSNKVQIYVNELNSVALGCTFFFSFFMFSLLGGGYRNSAGTEALVTKPGDLSSIPGSSLVKGEN